MTNATRSQQGQTPPAAALFGGLDEEPKFRGDRTRTRFEQIQDSPEFSTLRRKHRRFVFPIAVAFVLWYMLYVVLAAYAPGFMAHRLFGAVNVGLVLGVLQFLTTALVTALYVRYAHRVLDPQVDELRSNAGEEDA